MRYTMSFHTNPMVMLVMAALLGAVFFSPVSYAAKNKAEAGQTTTAKAANKSVKKQAYKKAPKAKRAQAALKEPPKFITESGQVLSGLYSEAVLVTDTMTGRPLYAKNQDRVIPIASVSKLMTAMVVLDSHLDLNEALTITDEDVDRVKNSHSRLNVGLVMRRIDLILLALMSSDNRAAHALGRNFPGGIPAFAKAMNDKARALDMNHTFFVEPTGLSSANVSTPRDLAKMVDASMKYPYIRSFSTTKLAIVEVGARKMTFTNTNPLVKAASEDNEMKIELSKTGHIREAGFCLTMAGLVNNRPVTIVLMDADSKRKRALDARRLPNLIKATLSTNTAKASVPMPL